MDIVDDQHRGTVLSEIADQPHQPSRRGVHCIARRRGPASLGRQRALRQPRRPDRQLVPQRQGTQRLEQLSRDSPSCVLLERTTARAEHDRTVVRASCPAAISNVDLPIPAGPSTTITRPDPERAITIRRRSSANSASRSNRIPTRPTVPCSSQLPPGAQKRSWTPPRCTQRRRHRSSGPMTDRERQR